MGGEGEARQDEPAVTRRARGRRAQRQGHSGWGRAEGEGEEEELGEEGGGE